MRSEFPSCTDTEILGKFPFERSENFGGVKGADCGEAQVPGVQRAVRSQQLISLVPEHYQTLGDREQSLTRIGQFDAPAAALEQFDAVSGLELLDLRGDRRLADT